MIYQIVSGICTWVVFLACIAITVFIWVDLIQCRNSVRCTKKVGEELRVSTISWNSYFKNYFEWYWAFCLIIPPIITIFLSFVLLGFF